MPAGTMTMAGPWAVSRVTPLAPVTITRPANVTAYAAGQVFGNGPGGDGRVSWVVPAFPTAIVNGLTLNAQVFGPAATTGYAGVFLSIVNNRPAADPTLGLNVIAFLGTPATVMHDQDALALSDADIALTYRGTGVSIGIPVTFTTGAGNNSLLNSSAAPNGRRGAQLGFGGLQLGFIPVGMTLTLYLWTTAAYVPISGETLTITPFLTWSGM